MCSWMPLTKRRKDCLWRHRIFASASPTSSTTSPTVSIRTCAARSSKRTNCSSHSCSRPKLENRRASCEPSSMHCWSKRWQALTIRWNSPTFSSGFPRPFGTNFARMPTRIPSLTASSRRSKSMRISGKCCSIVKCWPKICTRPTITTFRGSTVRSWNCSS